MADYPTYTDLLKPSSNISVDDFYQGADVNNCLNHDIAHTTSPPSPIGTPYFAAEHIYEGNWILNFFLHLHDSEKIGCQEMRDIFFAPNQGAGVGRAPVKGEENGKKWVQDIMAGLASSQNSQLLVFLRQNINGAKFRIFMDGNNIIEESVWKNAKPNEKMEKIATVGRAMDYLHQDDIGRKLKKTAENVEAALDQIVAAAASNPQLATALGKYAKKGALAKKHRQWVSSFVSSRNDVARTSIRRWASEASVQVEATLPGTPRATPTPARAHTDPTLSFLDVLQTAPPKGFDHGKWL
jgi:hypothetical protein